MIDPSKNNNAESNNIHIKENKDPNIDLENFIIPGDSENIAYVEKAGGLFYISNDGNKIFPVVKKEYKDDNGKIQVVFVSKKKAVNLNNPDKQNNEDDGIFNEDTQDQFNNIKNLIKQNSKDLDHIDSLQSPRSFNQNNVNCTDTTNQNENNTGPDQNTKDFSHFKNESFNPQISPSYDDEGNRLLRSSDGELHIPNNTDDIKNMRLDNNNLFNSDVYKDFPKKVRDQNEFHPTDHYDSELSENIDAILNMDKNYNNTDKHSIISKHNINNDKRLNKEVDEDENIHLEDYKNSKTF